MSVAGIFELVHRHAIKRVCTIVDDLIALLQRGRGFINLSAADQEQFVTWRLDVHEIVLEGLWDLYITLVDHLRRQLVLVHEFSVSLQDIDMTGYRSSNALCHTRHGALCRSTFGNCWSSLYLSVVIVYVTFEFFNAILCHRV